MQDGYNAVFSAIEQASEAGEDVHDAAEALAMEASQNMDAGRWVIGDLANLLEKRYGNDDVGKFAININVAKKTVRGYARTCGFWEKSARTDILERYPHPVITYSHMQLAVSLDDLNEAISFIEECANELLTVEQARLRQRQRLGKPAPAEKLAEFTACLVSQSQDGILVLTGQEELPDLPVKSPVKVTIHQLPQEKKDHAGQPESLQAANASRLPDRGD